MGENGEKVVKGEISIYSVYIYIYIHAKLMFGLFNLIYSLIFHEIV